MIRIVKLGLVCWLGMAVALGASWQPPGKVNLNTAALKELSTLPGIGPTTAERIIEFRTKNGAFKKIEDLMNVRGIGEKKFLRLRDLVTVSTGEGVQRPTASPPKPGP